MQQVVKKVRFTKLTKLPKEHSIYLQVENHKKKIYLPHQSNKNEKKILQSKASKFQNKIVTKIVIIKAFISYLQL